MLGQGCAALDPIAIVAIGDAVHIAHFCGVNVAANNAISAAAAGFFDNGFFKLGNEFDGVFDFVF